MAVNSELPTGKRLAENVGGTVAAPTDEHNTVRHAETTTHKGTSYRIAGWAGLQPATAAEHQTEKTQYG